MDLNHGGSGRPAVLLDPPRKRPIQTRGREACRRVEAGAYRLFARKRPEGITVRELLGHANTSPGFIKSHYDNIDRLVEVAVERCRDRVVAQIRAHVASRGTARARIQQVARHAAAVVATSDYRELLMVCLREPDRWKGVLDALAAALRTCAKGVLEDAATPVFIHEEALAAFADELHMRLALRPLLIQRDPSAAETADAAGRAAAELLKGIFQP